MDILGIINIPGWIMSIVLILLSLYLYSKYKQSYFKGLGFPGPQPILFIGGLGRMRKMGREAVDHENVREFGKCYAGFLGNLGGLMVADADMVKEICIKEFSSFHDRSQAISMTKFWKLAMTNASGEHWKYMRNTISPSFSSAKIRHMDPLVQKCIDGFVKSLEKKVTESDVVDVQQAFNDLTMDVIAATAFGMDVDCQSGEETEFAKMATRCMNIKPASTISILLSLFFPELKHVFDFFGGIEIIDKEAANYMKAVAKGVIEERRRSRNDGKSKHNDLLELMLRAHELGTSASESERIPEAEISNRILTDDEILANAVFFLLAGYDTTSTTMTWCTYCLATNPECQARLVDEIDASLGKERPSYANVRTLEYLDAFVSETLRLYPPAGRTNRVATNDVTICGRFIPAGTNVNLAISAMHGLDEYWPNPEKFDPERFLPENKGNIVPFSYLPFGIGPRNCIGRRLALLEIKIAIVTIFQRYRINKTDGVHVPPLFDKRAMFLKPVDGMSLRLEKRE